VRAIGKSDIDAYYRARYVPGNLVVVLAGRVQAAPALDAIEKLLVRRRGKTPRAAASRSRPRPRGHVAFKPRPGLEQAHVCFGFEAPPQTSRRRFAAALFDVALGGGMSSRLFQEVREKRGLAYSIGSAFNSYRLGGYETVSAACAPKNLPRLVEVTLRELSKLKRGGVSPRELARAKENLKCNMLLALESTVSRMSSAARQELYLGRVEPPEEILARVEAVRPEEVDAEAARLLDGRALSLAVVGSLPRLAVSRADLSSAL